MFRITEVTPENGGYRYQLVSETEAINGWHRASSKEEMMEWLTPTVHDLNRRSDRITGSRAGIVS